MAAIGAEARTRGRRPRQLNRDLQPPSPTLLSPELELGIAEPYGVPILKRRFVHAPAVHVAAVLTVEILQAKSAVDHSNRRVVAGDRLVGQHQVIVERAANLGGRALT